MKTLEEIKKILEKHKAELIQQYGLQEIGIFGSYVRNEQNRISDIDILVELSKEKKISLIDFVHLENYLSDLLGVKVDLVEKCTLKPNIGKHILKEVSYL